MARAEGITEQFKAENQLEWVRRMNSIVTKSVSRFARNTVDSLTTIRQLKENGIEVYFEKEYIQNGGNP